MNKQEALALKETIEIKDGIARQEKAIFDLEIKNANNRRNLFLLLGGFFLFIIGITAWANRSLRKKNKVLEAQKREIMLAQLLGQNNERRRMAGELHDNLNTKIAAIRWQLEALQSVYKGDDQQRLDKIIFQLTDVYEDVRLIAQNMMPDIVEEIGLVKSLSSLVETLNDANKVKFHLVTDIKDDNFSRQISYPLYNIIFEMINNILKHSQAQNAWVSISRTENEKINISVNDDGIGFSEENIVKGYGLKNITARVDNLNGHWQIDSAPQKGTKILIEIPDMY
jgi:signal transduction histidine kinase